MFLSLATPAMATTTITISENGVGSDNDAEVELSNDTTVVQNNAANVENKITSKSSTGDNSASYNTGGAVLISSGDAKSDVKVENLLNSNEAFVDCCDQGDLDIEISKNGVDSDNKVEVGDDRHHREESGIAIYQTNYADVENDVESEAETGDNDAKYNTAGDVAVITGNATSLVDVSTTANANWAKVGGDGSGADVSAMILENGVDSDNDIDLEFDHDILLTQYNNARLENDVKAEAETGDNDAKYNTGADVLIGTGDATVDVAVDNMVNFNWADADCGCIEDLTLKVAKNGVDSDNKIDLELDNDLEAYQDNAWCVFEPQMELGLLEIFHRGHRDCETEVEAEAETGDNRADDNTGDEHGGDPAVITGNATSEVDASNSGNVNIFGEDAPELPWDFDFHFSLDLDLGDLLALLH